MIITTKKHKRIVSLKDLEIRELKRELSYVRVELKEIKNELSKEQKQKNKCISDKEYTEELLEGVKQLVVQRNREVYDLNKEANELSDELDRTKEHLKDTDIALDLMIDKVNELEQENNELGDKLLTLNEDKVKLQKELKKHKTYTDRVNEMLRQYKWYIDKSIEASTVTHTLEYKDMKKFHSKEGIEGLIKLYHLAAMMEV